MHPVCFNLPWIGRPIYWYGVMVALGFLAGMINWSWLARRDGRPAELGSDVAIWTMVGGVVGARLFYVAINLSYYLARPLEILRVDEGGLVFYGGFLGGCLGVVLLARRRGYPLWGFADYVITGVPLGHAFGRVGCFLNGCCYGSPTSCFLGVHFPAGSTPNLAHPDTLLHPVQLYEVAVNLLLYGVLVWRYLRRPRPRAGTLFALYLVAYGVARFLLELLRGDHPERFVRFGLVDAQYVSLLLIAAGLILWRVRTRRGTDGAHDVAA